MKASHTQSRQVISRTQASPLSPKAEVISPAPAPLKSIPMNTTSEGCAFAIRTGYERHAYLNGMTRGGGFYPATGVMEIYETEEDSAEHGD